MGLADFLRPIWDTDETYNTPEMLGNMASGVGDIAGGLFGLGKQVLADPLAAPGLAVDVVKGIPADYRERYSGDILQKMYEQPAPYLFDVADAATLGMGGGALARKGSRNLSSYLDAPAGPRLQAALGQPEAGIMGPAVRPGNDFLYHGTGGENLATIGERGLDAGHWAQRQGYAQNFAGPEGAVLRTPRQPGLTPGDTPDSWQMGNVEPGNLEMLRGDEWGPLPQQGGFSEADLANLMADPMSRRQALGGIGRGGEGGYIEPGALPLTNRQGQQVREYPANPEGLMGDTRMIETGEYRNAQGELGPMPEYGMHEMGPGVNPVASESQFGGQVGSQNQLHDVAKRQKALIDQARQEYEAYKYQALNSPNHPVRLGAQKLQPFEDFLEVSPIADQLLELQGEMTHLQSILDQDVRMRHSYASGENIGGQGDFMGAGGGYQPYSIDKHVPEAGVEPMTSWMKSPEGQPIVERIADSNLLPKQRANAIRQAYKDRDTSIWNEMMAEQSGRLDPIKRTENRAGYVMGSGGPGLLDQGQPIRGAQTRVEGVVQDDLALPMEPDPRGVQGPEMGMAGEGKQLPTHLGDVARNLEAGRTNRTLMDPIALPSENLYAKYQAMGRPRGGLSIEGTATGLARKHQYVDDLSEEMRHFDNVSDEMLQKFIDDGLEEVNFNSRNTPGDLLDESDRQTLIHVKQAMKALDYRHRTGEFAPRGGEARGGLVGAAGEIATPGGTAPIQGSGFGPVKGQTPVGSVGGELERARGGGPMDEYAAMQGEADMPRMVGEYVRPKNPTAVARSYDTFAAGKPASRADVEDIAGAMTDPAYAEAYTNRRLRARKDLGTNRRGLREQRLDRAGGTRSSSSAAPASENPLSTGAPPVAKTTAAETLDEKVARLSAELEELKRGEVSTPEPEPPSAAAVGESLVEDAGDAFATAYRELGRRPSAKEVAAKGDGLTPEAAKSWMKDEANTPFKQELDAEIRGGAKAKTSNRRGRKQTESKRRTEPEAKKTEPTVVSDAQKRFDSRRARLLKKFEAGEISRADFEKWYNVDFEEWAKRKNKTIPGV